MPRVSVVVSVLDGELHIREAMESVLGQTLDDLELIVVDDGSTDSTRDVIRSFQDPRVVLIEHEFQFPAGNGVDEMVL